MESETHVPSRLARGLQTSATLSMTHAAIPPQKKSWLKLAKISRANIAPLVHYVERKPYKEEKQGEKMYNREEKYFFLDN